MCPVLSDVLFTLELEPMVVCPHGEGWARRSSLWISRKHPAEKETLKMIEDDEGTFFFLSLHVCLLTWRQDIYCSYYCCIYRRCCCCWPRLIINRGDGDEAKQSANGICIRFLQGANLISSDCYVRATAAVAYVADLLFSFFSSLQQLFPRIYI